MKFLEKIPVDFFEGLDVFLVSSEPLLETHQVQNRKLLSDSLLVTQGELVYVVLNTSVLLSAEGLDFPLQYSDLVLERSLDGRLVLFNGFEVPGKHWKVVFSIEQRLLAGREALGSLLVSDRGELFPEVFGENHSAHWKRLQKYS